MPKVTVKYVDKECSPEEIIATAKRLYGENCEITIEPESLDPDHLLYFAIQLLISDEQVDIMYGDQDLYDTSLQKFRTKWAAALDKKIGYILNSVIMDNQDRF